MRTSIATVSIAGSLREKLVAISRAGFDGYEIFEPDLVASTMSPEEIRALSSDLGLTIDLYQPFRDFEGVDARQLDLNLSRARAKFELMNRLGVETMLVCSNVATANSDDDGLAAEQLRAMADLAQEHGIRLAYEALAWGRFVSTYERSWRIVQIADHPSLGLCLDSFHILSLRSSLEAIDAIPGDKIFYCQLADAPALSMDVLSWSRHHRLFPGEGQWDIADFTARVLRTGYSGPLSLEVFNDVFRQGVPSVTARDAFRSLIVLGDSLSAGTAAPQTAPFVALPHLQVPRGIAFVEVQPGEGDGLDCLLAALGFSYRGRHRRKFADLYELGTARVVVNYNLPSESAGIVAVGLVVDDVAAAADRARALTSTAVARDIRGDEQQFAAILAPNGIEFYFCEESRDGTDWWHEFGPVGPERSADQPECIDHIALRQGWQRGDEATQFFRAIVGLDIDEGQDLASQVGLVRSRSLTTPDRSVRLALNVTPTDGRSEGRFLDHVALGTDDVFQAARDCRERGLDGLHVPSNYYDDLAARFELSQALLEQLAEFSVLYEKDAKGEFYHFYTQPVGSLFFEVVQRVSAYDAYGATNSFVRMAAQRAKDA